MGPPLEEGPTHHEDYSCNPAQAFPLPEPDSLCLVLQGNARFPVCVGEIAWCQGIAPHSPHMGPKRTRLPWADLTVS